VNPEISDVDGRLTFHQREQARSLLIGIRHQADKAELHLKSYEDVDYQAAMQALVGFASHALNQAWAAMPEYSKEAIDAARERDAR
jgi:hypothetical protein